MSGSKPHSAHLEIVRAAFEKLGWNMTPVNALEEQYEGEKAKNAKLSALIIKQEGQYRDEKRGLLEQFETLRLALEEALRLGPDEDPTRTLHDTLTEWVERAQNAERDLATAREKNEKLSALIVGQEKLYREERKAAERELKRIRSVPSHQRTLQVLAERERADAAERERDEALRAASLLHPATAGLISDQRDIRLAAAERDLATAREALERIGLELGEPGENYPTPVNNAVVITRAALRSLGEKA